MRSNGKFELNAVIVFYSCSDGKLRPVKFAGKNAKQIHGYITHIQGGKIDLRDEEALLVHDTPQVRAAMEALENPKKTLRSLTVEKLSRVFGAAKPQKVFVQTPSDEDHEVSCATQRSAKVSEAIRPSVGE